MIQMIYAYDVSDLWIRGVPPWPSLDKKFQYSALNPDPKLDPFTTILLELCWYWYWYPTNVK